jgi:DNA-binding CsgD family transcriptional regulator
MAADPAPSADGPDPRLPVTGVASSAGAGAPNRDPVLGQPGYLRPDAARRVATDAERRALASVLRLRILRLCLYEPLTNREIAQRLGRNPATVLHHVRTLVDQGFLVAGQPRRGRRGSREIPYRSTGKSWTLELAEPAGSAGSGGASNTLLRTVLAEVALVPESEVDASRLGLQLSPEHTEELRSRLAALLDEFARRPQDPGGRRWSLFLAMHPEP